MMIVAILAIGLSNLFQIFFVMVKLVAAKSLYHLYRDLSQLEDQACQKSFHHSLQIYLPFLALFLGPILPPREQVMLLQGPHFFFILLGSPIS